jgi:flagellar protein FlbD
MLTRLNGARFVLNPDLIERVESTPDTVITLVDGKHYLVTEGLLEVVDLVQRSRAALLAEVATTAPATGPHLVDDATSDSTAHDHAATDHAHGLGHGHADEGAVIPMRRHL